MKRLVAVLPRVAIAGCLVGTGYIHAYLYSHGYRVVPVVGPAFLLQGAGSFAVAILLLIGNPVVARLGAAGLCVGALGGFLASRTTGIAGFTERGLNPAPQAVLSLLFELVALALLAAPPIRRVLASRHRSPV